jgi:predicted nucleotide-binding protein (sugar kinase/HSP70/actin superfamily)
MLKPFACNPETVIEPVVEKIGRDYNMPVLILSIDEATLETHFQTRIESFVDILTMSKGKK